MTREEIIQEIVEEYKKKFGLCSKELDVNCGCSKEIKWLRTALLKISDLSMDAVEVEEKSNILTTKKRLTYSDIDHEHIWHYNEAKEVAFFDYSNNTPGYKWEVVRFCERCYEVETVDLLSPKE